MLANMRAFHGSFPRSTQAINRALNPGLKGPAPLSLFAQVEPAHRIPAYNTAMLSWRAVKIIQHIVQTEAPFGGSIAAPLLKAFATDDALDHRLAIQISTHPCLPPGSNALCIITSHHTLGYHALQLLLKFHCCTRDPVSDLRVATAAFHIVDRSGCLLFIGLDVVQQILSRLSLLDDTRIDYRSTFSHIVGQLLLFNGHYFNNFNLCWSTFVHAVSTDHMTLGDDHVTLSQVLQLTNRLDDFALAFAKLAAHQERLSGTTPARPVLAMSQAQPQAPQTSIVAPTQDSELARALVWAVRELMPTPTKHNNSGGGPRYNRW